jgi:hypothetical protein
VSRNSRLPLLPLHDEASRRHTRDQLEALTALIAAPSFDPLFRPSDVIVIPPDHPVFRWQCLVQDCARPRSKSSADLCAAHHDRWRTAERAGTTMGEFVRHAEPLPLSEWLEDVPCRVCPDRPAFSIAWRLCARHHHRWTNTRDGVDFAAWLADQQPQPGYARCRVPVCDERAFSPLRLCASHDRYYRQAGRPGGARLPGSYWARFESRSRAVPVHVDDEVAFRAWCHAAQPIYRPGRLILRALRPLVSAEIRWGLFQHTQRPHTQWRLAALQEVINGCRIGGVNSLADLDLAACKPAGRSVVMEMLHDLRLVYFTPADTREAGFLDTDHFGVRFPNRAATSTSPPSRNGGCATTSGTTWPPCSAQPAAHAGAARWTTCAAPSSSSVPSCLATRPAAATTRPHCARNTWRGSSPTSGAANAKACPRWL